MPTAAAMMIRFVRTRRLTFMPDRKANSRNTMTIRAPRDQHRGQRIACPEHNGQQRYDGSGHIADPHDHATAHGRLCPPPIPRRALPGGTGDARSRWHGLPPPSWWRRKRQPPSTAHRPPPPSPPPPGPWPRLPKALERTLYRPQDLHQTIVEAEEDVPDPIGVDPALRFAGGQERLRA